MKAWLLIFILFFLPNAWAFTNITCLNNSTLAYIKTFTFSEDGSVSQYEFMENETCNWGCDNKTNTCNPAPIKQDLYIGGIVMGLFILFGFIMMKIRV